MSYGTIHPSQVAERDLREAAARTLDAVPGAEAVLLFGSRARGNADPESDWDIAIVTSDSTGRCEPSDRTPIEALGPRVNALYLSRDQLCDKRNSPGHVAREILREGRLLAGRMPRVGRIERSPPMKYEEFLEKSSSALDDMAAAGHAFGRAIAGEPQKYIFRSAPSFVRHSADAAEHLAKLMMFRRGVAPPRWHDLNGLAEFLESSDPDGRWSETAAAIRAMNGHSRRHHMAAYSGVKAEDISHAIDRLQRVCEAFVAECADAARDPGLSAAAEEQIADLRQSSAEVARELAAVRPRYLEVVEVMTKRLAARYADRNTAREHAGEIVKAGEAMNGALPVVRDLYDRLARAELPRPPAQRKTRSSSSDFSP
ncbi:MAG: nucleotidyltransferase domain-containing protein [Rhodospirillaceae bacterium]|nr:nucleotidyltransferase domain-containing protein [Rhodospirillaceae bacterium]